MEERAREKKKQEIIVERRGEMESCGMDWCWC